MLPGFIRGAGIFPLFHWESPEPGELFHLRARYEELERNNTILKAELEKLSSAKEDLKNTYNNYFLQVQSLINQKAV